MPKTKFIWLLFPGFVFLGLLAFLVSQAPNQSAVTTTSQSPNKNITPTSPNLAVPTALQSLNDQIKAFRLDDPELTAPSFDRNLEIPVD